MSSELFNLATATTTTSSSSKSFVYREVDNVHLDRLCHQQVIRHAQYVTSNNGSDGSSSTCSLSPPGASCSHSNNMMETNNNNNSLVNFASSNEPDDTNLLDTKVSNELALKSNLNPNASSFTSVIYRKSTYVDYLLPNSSTSSMLDGLFFNQLCTLHMDMTYDDRVFFGVHNFYGLKQQLSLHQCNIDFAAPDNKVSLFGGLANVQSMAEVLSRHSPLALQIEFRFYTPDLVEHIKSRATFFYGRYETAFKVFITYHQVKADTVLFSFLTNRSCWRNLYEVMALFKYEYELTRYGEFSHVMSSTLQLPSNRKDITGRGNVHIEEIRQKTKTDIDIVRLEEYPQYPFDNVTIKGQRFQDVINARLLLLERFVYTLIFQVPMCDTRLLVECISKLGHDLKSINIIIEPSSSTIYKVVSITGNQPNLGKLFALRNQLAAQYAH